MVLVDDKTLDGTPIEQLTKGSDKKVKLSCDDCGTETTTTWNNYNNAQKRHNRSGETYCKRCSGKKNGVKSRGRKWKKKPHQIQTREQHPSWKGGRYVSSDGYIMVNVKIGRHSNQSGWGNYKKEHVVVMEKHLNRKLRKNEVVHHINGIKTDNSLENLFLTDHRGHRTLHSSLMGIGYMLVKLGHIKFDDTKYVADQKLRELLGHPEEDNQQPSLGGDTPEGSTTRCESQEDNNTPTSAGHNKNCDDIV